MTVIVPGLGRVTDAAGFGASVSRSRSGNSRTTSAPPSGSTAAKVMLVCSPGNTRMGLLGGVQIGGWLLPGTSCSVTSIGIDCAPAVAMTCTCHFDAAAPAVTQRSRQSGVTIRGAPVSGITGNAGRPDSAGDAGRHEAGVSPCSTTPSCMSSPTPAGTLMTGARRARTPSARGSRGSTVAYTSYGAFGPLPSALERQHAENPARNGPADRFAYLWTRWISVTIQSPSGSGVPGNVAGLSSIHVGGSTRTPLTYITSRGVNVSWVPSPKSNVSVGSSYDEAVQPVRMSKSTTFGSIPPRDHDTVPMRKNAASAVAGSPSASAAPTKIESFVIVIPSCARRGARAAADGHARARGSTRGGPRGSRGARGAHATRPRR